MDKLADVIHAAYEARSTREIEAVLSSAKDALESAGGGSQDIHAVVRVLLNALVNATDANVIEWTLDTLASATFHPDFGSVDLDPLVDYLRHAEPQCLAVGLEVLGMSHNVRHRSFLVNYLGHSDEQVSTAASEAISELDLATNAGEDAPEE